MLSSLDSTIYRTNSDKTCIQTFFIVEGKGRKGGGKGEGKGGEGREGKGREGRGRKGNAATPWHRRCVHNK